MWLDIAIEWALAPLQYAYMQHAILTSAMVGALCGMLSVLLILKGWSLIGDALSHAVVPGVAIAYACNFPFAVGAAITGGLAAVAMALLKQITHLKQDAIIGLVFSTFFAAGLFIISLVPTSININSIIFGNILAITQADMIQIAVTTVIAALLISLKWRDLMLVFFDEGQASSMGLPVRRYQWLFYCLLSASVLAGLKSVGAILVVAMVVTPGATAYLLCKNFRNTMLLSTVIGFTTSLFGAWLSYHTDTTTGPLIVVMQTGCFILAFLFSPYQGLIGRRLSFSLRRQQVISS
uniref:metal ABC transporter permease n=1 Tax=Thaumasiovibrio occultus TaxID=1891184 RepID=UPI000B355F1E|nr:metal ABC transporter permease [Thaumasiovibrio occultus]